MASALGIAGFGLLVCGFFLGSWGLGIERENYEAALSAREQQAEEALELSRELADVRLAQAVDTGANEQLRQTINDLTDQIGALEEEVQFYKRLMAPSEAQRGLRIETLDVTRTGDPARFSYSLLLTQIVDRHRWIQGNVRIDVIGQQAGTQQVLSLTDLAMQDTYPLKFRFRYFQDFNGAITIPDGFAPQQVRVTAQTGGSKGQRLQRTFKWSVQEG